MERSIAEQLAELRVVYAQEKVQREKKHTTAITNAEREVAAAKAYDYVAEFCESYESALASLEELFADIAQTHATTKGLSFRVGSYIQTVKPRAIGRGLVEEHFDKLVSECKGALADIGGTDTPEDDIGPLKIFCQGLVDLRFIVQNGRRLAEETGVPEEWKKESVAEAKAKLNRCKAERDAALKLECFDCYERLLALKARIVQNSVAVHSQMLGNNAIGGQEDYHFLMGFYTQTMPEESKAFARDVLGLSNADLSVNPIFFELKSGHSTILINAPKKFFKEFAFDDLITNIYFTFVSSLPAKELLFTGIEAGAKSAALGGLSMQIGETLDSAIFHPVETDFDGSDKIFACMKTIEKTAMDRSMVYRARRRGNSIPDIFQYNATVAENRDKFILFMVNHYPCGFNSNRGNGYEALKDLAVDGGEKGVITVICQATDETFEERTPKLTADELGADLIEITDDGVLYNGQGASLEIRSPEFDITEYWDALRTYFKNASALWLKDVIKRGERIREERIAEKKEIPSSVDVLHVPIGNNEGNHFELALRTCSAEGFALLVGATESGKSSFLHTFILSAASRYSPDELRFCLVDFKSETDSPEFSQYRKITGEENLYIPHIDYLLVNGKAECVFDLFGKIDALKRERSAILAPYGLSEVNKYNALPEVQSGKLPRLPQIYFIIDEYNVMINGGMNRSSAVKQRIIKALESTVKAVRSFGIGIILSGQSVDDGIVGGALDQMFTRIALRNQNEGDYARLMHCTTQEARSDLEFLIDKGYAIFSTNGGRTRQKVRLAYSGYTGCKWQREQAKKIREKYGVALQVEAGSEKPFLISEAKGLESFIPEQKDSFVIPMGVASASMLKTGMEFSTSNRCLNYFAFADAEKLLAVERNAMFGYLDAASALYGSAVPQITYMALSAIARECMDDYRQTYPFLDKHIKEITKRPQMAEEIARLFSIYEDRKKKLEDDIQTDFPAMFVVIHDVEWLKDPSADWVPKHDEKKDEVADSGAKDAFEAEAEAFAKERKISIDAARKILAVTGKAKPAARSAATSASRKFLTASDYADMFGKLYAFGNRYGIFMLVCSENYSPIERVLLTATNERDAAIEKCSMYGSAEEKSEHMRDSNAARDCFYICPSSTKIRAYDYAPEKNGDWWKALAERLGDTI